jgi:hypothetical protein
MNCGHSSRIGKKIFKSYKCDMKKRVEKNAVWRISQHAEAV